MAIGVIQSALRDLYGPGWGLPPLPSAAPAAPDKPGRLSGAAAGAPALGGPEPPAGQPDPHRVQPSPESGQAGGEGTGEGQDRRGNDPAAPAAPALDQGDQALLRHLQTTDKQVRAHEQAHVAAGGPHVSGGASFTYQTGPDGRQYAVGGEVPIDASPVPGDPEATIDKARTIRAAALAPADPSPQDRQVAAQAARMEAQARLEKAQEEQARREAGVTDATAGGDLVLSRAKEPPPPLWARLRAWSLRV